jgi:hypothetical protein
MHQGLARARPGLAHALFLSPALPPAIFSPAQVVLKNPVISAVIEQSRGFPVFARYSSGIVTFRGRNKGRTEKWIRDLFRAVPTIWGFSCKR